MTLALRLMKPTLLIKSNIQRKRRFNATDMLDGICTCETGIIFDNRTDTRVDVKKNTSPLTCDRVWVLHIRDAFY